MPLRVGASIPLLTVGAVHSIADYADGHRPCTLPRGAGDTPSKKPPRLSTGGLISNSSLTMTYFHTGTRTIIGAEVFHCPVRDGKEWDHLAMVIRLERSAAKRDPALTLE